MSSLPDREGRFGRFLDELRQRKVVRTCVLYVAGAWALLQFAALVFPLLGLSDEALRWVLWMECLGLVAACFLGWSFDIQALRPGESRRWLSIPTVVLALALVAGGSAAAWSVDRWTDSTAPAESLRGASLVVLPFSADGEAARGSEQFGQGLSQDIGAALSRFAELQLFLPGSGTSSSSDAVAMARDLGAQYALSGQVRWSRDEFRIMAVLSSADTGSVVWSEVYDRERGDHSLFDVHDDIAGRVAATLADRTGVIARDLARRSRDVRVADLSPYACVLRAYRYFEVHTDAQHAEARECLEQVVQREPRYAEAWAHLAYLYREEHLHRRNERADSLERALDAAGRAIQLDRGNAMAHFAHAVTLGSRGDMEAARRAGRRAIQLNGNDASLLGLLATNLAIAGQWKEAASLARRAAELNPRHPSIVHNVFALQHYVQGDYEAALAAHERIREYDGMRAVVRAAILGKLGRPDDAKAVLDPFLQSDAALSTDLVGELRRYYVSDALVEPLAEGLRAGGIDLTPQPLLEAPRSSYPTRSRGQRSVPAIRSAETVTRSDVSRFSGG